MGTIRTREAVTTHSLKVVVATMAVETSDQVVVEATGATLMEIVMAISHSTSVVVAADDT